MIRVLPLLAVLAAGTALGTTQRPTASGTIRGVVRHAGSGEAIPGAQVTLTDGTSTSSDPDPITTTTSNASGAFSIPDLEEGVYRVAVMSNGYARRESRVALGAGEVLDDLVVGIAPAGTISGRVFSTSGQPFVGARVSLIRRGFYARGTPILITVASAEVNDLGEYRLYWISPGRYYVMAEGHNGGSDVRYEFETGARLGYNLLRETGAVRYFPGVPEISTASVIEVEEGTELVGIDFTLPPQQLFSIRGRLVDPLTGQPPPEASVSLSRTGGSRSSVRWYDPVTGILEIPDLEPGRYGLSASAGDAILFLPGGIQPETARASAEIVISDSDVERLDLRIREHPVINGRARIEGTLPEEIGIDRLRVRLTLADLEDVSFGAPNVALEPDRTFALPAMEVGRYRVTMTGLPEGFYLKEALLNGRDVLSAASNFSDGGNLEVVVSPNAGHLEGQVLDADGRPAVAVDAVLIPDVLRSHPELYQNVVTDHEGRFRFGTVPPGDYKVFAWEHVESYGYFNEEALREFEDRGVRIRVEQSSQVTVEVELIPGEIVP